MKVVLTHLAVVTACVAVFLPAFAQDINPAPDGQPAPDFNRANEFNPEHVVRSILQDTEGRYRFGTQHSGVYRFDGRELMRFSEHEGTILEDQRGTVWFGTAKGNNRFDAGGISTFSDRDYSSRTTAELNRVISGFADAD